jgi:cytochrome c-type biogenesis protein
MESVGVLAALFGGLISFVSPCVLPLVPAYLCYVGGVSIEELGRDGRSAAATGPVVGAAVGFVLGFTTVFVALGATASALGRALASYWGALSVVAGLVVIAMGLHFLGVFRIALLFREARVQAGPIRPGMAGAYALGLAFALGWTPCIGPILAAILGLAGAAETLGRGAALLAVYSLGLGIPFIVAAAFAPAFLGWLGSFRRYLPMVEKVMGGFLVLTGIFFITGQMSTMSFWLLETFPVLGRIG